MLLHEIVTIACLLLFTACCFIIYCVWSKKKDNEDFKNKHPKPQCTTMQYYDADYLNIAEQIEKAKGIRHMQHIKERICSFRRQYLPYQNLFVLHTDYKKLLSSWKDKNNTFIIRSIITPEQKN